MNLKLIEPLKEFFKDEVRVLGDTLGLSKNITNRHPFPGPGLGIRIVGNIREIKMLQEADHIYINELKKASFTIRFGKHMLHYCPSKQLELWGTQELMNILVY